MLNKDDQKKLLMHYLSNFDPTEELNLPIPLEESHSLLDRFSNVDIAPDIAFKIEGNATTSSIRKLTYLIRLFIGGKLIGYFNKTGLEPEIYSLYFAIHTDGLKPEEQVFSIKKTKFEKGKLYSRQAMDNLLVAVENWTKETIQNMQNENTTHIKILSRSKALS